MWRWKWYEDDHLYIRGDNAYDVDNNDDHNANDDDIADSHNANDDDHPMLMMMNIPYNSDNKFHKKKENQLTCTIQCTLNNEYTVQYSMSSFVSKW